MSLKYKLELLQQVSVHKALEALEFFAPSHVRSLESLCDFGMVPSSCSFLEPDWGLEPV